MGTLTRNQPAPPADTEKNQPKVGDIRRIGPYGPIYEVIAIESAEAITIRELESERVTRDYPIVEFQADLVE